MGLILAMGLAVHLLHPGPFSVWVGEYKDGYRLLQAGDTSERITELWSLTLKSPRASLEGVRAEQDGVLGTSGTVKAADGSWELRVVAQDVPPYGGLRIGFKPEAWSRLKPEALLEVRTVQGTCVNLKKLRLQDLKEVPTK